MKNTICYFKDTYLRVYIYILPKSFWISLAFIYSYTVGKTRTMSLEHRQHNSSQCDVTCFGLYFEASTFFLGFFGARSENIYAKLTC